MQTQLGVSDLFPATSLHSAELEILEEEKEEQTVFFISKLGLNKV